MDLMSVRYLLCLSAFFVVAACSESGSAPRDAVANAESAAAGAGTAVAASRLRDSAPVGRLPDTVRPTAYALDLTIDPREPEFHGRVTITLQIDEAIDHLWLHGKNIDVAEVWLTSGDERRVEARYTEVLETGVSRIALASRIAAGKHRLTLVYSAPFDTSLAGLFRVERGGDWYALAKSESIQARRAVPGFDEPGFKAPWDISLTIPAGQVAIAISPERVREPVDEGMERIRFETSRPTSTYLLSLAVGPFERIESETLPPTEIREYAVPVSGWARQGKSDQLRFILSLTRTMVEAFEVVTKTPYPYRKLDVIAAPDWPSGATELASSPTYREDIILSRGDPGPVQTRRIVGIHAHELAHMWFGDLVTPPWWNDLWLKEGFAVWGEPMAAIAWNADGGYELDWVTAAIDGLRADSLASARAVREPIERNETIRSAYDGITYDKGSALLRMAEVYLGADLWRDGLATYLAEFEDGAANADDFARVMGKAVGDADFEASLNGFLNRNGAPLLRFEAMLSGDGRPALSVAQSRYRPLGSPIDPDRSWIIPVCVRHAGGSDCQLIGPGDDRITLSSETPPDWFMPNADGAGYYRFALTENGWTALNAHFDELAPSEAMMALDSAGAAFEAGATAPRPLLDLIETASVADSLDVRWEAASLLNRYLERLYADKDPRRGRLAAYSRARFADQYRALNIPRSEAERLYRQRLRGFLAGPADDSLLREALGTQAAAFAGLNGPPDPDALEADDYAAAAGAAVQTHGAGFLDAFFANRDAINDARFERSVISAAGLVDDPAVRDDLMAMALADALEPSEVFSLIASLMANDAARPAVWAWIGSNAQAIAERVPAQWRRRVPALAGQFCSSARVGELDAFVDRHGSLFPGYERGVAQAKERIVLCEALRDTQAAAFSDAIAAR